LSVRDQVSCRRGCCGCVGSGAIFCPHVWSVSKGPLPRELILSMHRYQLYPCILFWK
jgi:hypothetical protein